MPKSTKSADGPKPAESAPASQARTTKNDVVLKLLRRPEGASLDDLVAATGWLPHSARAALTGLRKRGHAISKEKVDGTTRYRTGAAA